MKESVHSGGASKAVSATVLAVEFPINTEKKMGGSTRVTTVGRFKKGFLKVKLPDGEKITFKGDDFVTLIQTRWSGEMTKGRWDAILTTKPEEIMVVPAFGPIGWKIVRDELSIWVNRAKTENHRNQMKKM